ncbi:hypothetical protein H9660_14190 [Clostridium sp. Sa3CUN1]|uniref:Uncharacterized protein n=1 Tax=Clostridium gallinarum TaxID=2762246 RepID=A0ABR8Q789_9CLOT|nr:hypothetical protein [Clostridium gallinarum]MBD7916293.1 hypothetical protein [Clostridium gallinarum]
MRKFESVKRIEGEVNKKLTKEEKQLLKEEKRRKRAELKELKKENKKVLLSTKEFLKFKDVDEENKFIMENGKIDIFQIESIDIYSLSEVERKIYIYNFISFLRTYIYEFKIICMNFPVNTYSQQEFLKHRLSILSESFSKLDEKISNSEDESIRSSLIREKSLLEKREHLLNEQLEQLIFLENNRQNKEFYLMIFIKDSDNEYEIMNLLKRSQNLAVKLREIDLEKKLKILFKINNPNTRLS